jgi:poly(A) polymerase
VTDPFGGLADLDRHVIRSISQGTFKADPVRLLRAVRLAAELDFGIDEGTERLIGRHAHLIAGVAGERVREELLRLFALRQSGRFVAHLDRLGLLTIIFPELAEARDVGQPKEHHWDVLEHSLKTVSATDFLLRQGDWEYAEAQVLAAVPWTVRLAEHFARPVGGGSTGGSLLKLAALLHDVAKPRTRTVEPDGRMRFLGHAQEGATTAVSILQRLRFSAREASLVETMVRHHLRPVQMSQGGLPTTRAVYRYFRDVGEAGIETLFLSLADHLASRGPELDLAAWREHTGLVDYVLTRHFERESQPRPAKLIDGHDLMALLGMRPGPRLGAVLEAVREAQACGEIKTRQEALDYVRSLPLVREADDKS